MATALATPYFPPSYFPPSYFGGMAGAAVEVPVDPVDPLEWCTADDVLLYYPALINLMDRAVDSMGFPELIQLATSMVRRALEVAYAPIRGLTLRRLASLDPADMGPLDARRYRVLQSQDMPDPLVVVPSAAQYAAWLDAGRLVLDEPIREAVARRTIALVLDRATTSTGSNSYRDERDFQARAAADILRRYAVRLDVDGDGRPDWEVRGGTRAVQLTGGVSR